MPQAENCRCFHKHDSNLGIDINNYNIEETYKEPASYRPEYKVIIAGSSSFNDDKLFNDKCNFYLSKKWGHIALSFFLALRIVRN